MDQLVTAIRNGDLRSMDIILNDQNIDLNIVLNYNGETPLILAVKTGNIYVVETLLHYGADINFQNGGGTTVLMDASVYGNVAIVEWLVQHGANLELHDEDHNTALQYASVNGQSQIIKLLVDHHINMNSKNRYGNTALHDAVTNQDLDSINILLQAGAQLLPDNDGITPLHIAKMENHADIVELLENYELEIEIKEPEGN